MTLLEKMERRFGFLAIPHLTLYLVGGQALAFILCMMKPESFSMFTLQASRVLDGEWWRLILFVFMPSTTSPFWVFFNLYMFHLMGSALESYWGAFRYNLFLFIGFVATVVASFLVPYREFTNLYLGGSIFLAFAQLNPDFVISVFFVLPVKLRWLALLTWLSYGWMFVMGGLSVRLMVLASVVNFFVFFAHDLYLSIRRQNRQVRQKVLARVVEPESMHSCGVCGITEKTNRQMEFRYCTDCRPARCFCADHMDRHEHGVTEPGRDQPAGSQPS